MGKNKVKLEMLGIEFDTEGSFRDDGFVENIAEHSLRIYNEFYPDDDNPYEALSLDAIRAGSIIRRIGGAAIGSGREPISVVICCYARLPSLEKEIFVRGHEETHALHWLGRIDLLQEAMNERGSKIEIKPRAHDAIEAWEPVADIGGLYALQRHGASLDEIRQLNMGQRVFELYEASMYETQTIA